LALRSAAALTAALAAALQISPISAGLAAPSERPGLGAHPRLVDNRTVDASRFYRAKWKVIVL
jgi:hypothetical protein